MAPGGCWPAHWRPGWSAQSAAKKAIQDIYNAEDRDHAIKVIKTSSQLYGAKFRKAVKKIFDDRDQLLAFSDFPAEHWIHLRTTNPIESTSTTIRLRTRVTRGVGSRTAALAMVLNSSSLPCSGGAR